MFHPNSLAVQKRFFSHGIDDGKGSDISPSLDDRDSLGAQLNEKLCANERGIFPDLFAFFIGDDDVQARVWEKVSNILDIKIDHKLTPHMAVLLHVKEHGFCDLKMFGNGQELELALFEPGEVFHGLFFVALIEKLVPQKASS